MFNIIIGLIYFVASAIISMLYDIIIIITDLYSAVRL